MQNINISNGLPFTDTILINRIKQLENETPILVNVPYTTFANPTTTECVLLNSTGLVSKQALYAEVNSIVNLTSNISGIQTFTFNLYLAGVVVATSVVTIPDALNTLISANVRGSITYSRTNAGDPEYIANLVVTPLATSASASVSTVTVVNTQSDITNRSTIAGVYNVKLSCTASVGTATTTITAMGGRLTVDNRN